MKIGVAGVLVLIIFAGAGPAFSGKGMDGMDSVAEANGTFGFSLYRELADRPGNLFFSPYSISVALAMTYAGARGITEAEMARVLHFTLGQEELHRAFSQVQDTVRAAEREAGISLRIANSLWCQDGYRLLEPFVRLVEENYGAALHFVDFVGDAEKSRAIINGWVEEKTEQKIKDLIPPGAVNALTRLVLCNAIYFMGTWHHPFKKEWTREDTFYVGAGHEVTVPMMTQTEKFRYREFENFTAIEMPYAKKRLSMIVFLPKDRAGLARLEKEVTYARVKEWMDLLSRSMERKVKVVFPKFKTTSAFQLADVLSRMGMPHAFVDADFSGMTGNRELAISQVIHKAFVEVHEKGTEAAAATAVVMAKAMALEPQLFRADHPFLFLIRENRTGTILFVGRVVDPSR